MLKPLFPDHKTTNMVVKNHVIM